MARLRLRDRHIHRMNRTCGGEGDVYSFERNQMLAQLIRITRPYPSLRIPPVLNIAH